jgi:hypothetical protein
MNKKKKKKNLKLSNKSKIVTLSIILAVVIGLVVFSNDLMNLKDSSADSKRYNKTYAAGKLVNYKPTPFKYYRGKLVSVKSQGGNIRMPAKPGGPMIDGWRMDHADEKRTINNEGWVYFSKWFTIPTSKRPMAVYVCWRALEKNTTIKLRLSRDINKVWGTKDGAYHINFTHRYETDPNRYREIACWGFYDVGYKSVVPRSHPQSEPIHPGQYAKRIKKSIKAKLFIKVPEGGIELASIKIFEPTKPQEHDSNGYYLRQFETDITR